MKSIEILSGGNVINTILASEQFAQEAYPGAWRLAAVQPVAAVAIEDKRITKLAFRNRFTTAEKVAIEIAGLDNPAATMPERAQAAALRANQADLAVSTFIDLSRADTRAGVQMLEAAGLLAAGRELVILDAPITAEERPL